MSDGVLGIGRYQLENLIRQDIGFLFADLRSEEERSAYQDPLLKNAQPMTEESLKAALAGAAHDAAIILLSEDGKVASDVATRLAGDGFMNVYIVRGGVQALHP